MTPRPASVDWADRAFSRVVRPWRATIRTRSALIASGNASATKSGGPSKMTKSRRERARKKRQKWRQQQQLHGRPQEPQQPEGEGAGQERAEESAAEEAAKEKQPKPEQGDGGAQPDQKPEQE